jgi:hypothetical protein
MWLAGSGGVFALTFGVGHLLLGRPYLGTVELLLGCLLLALTILGLRRTSRMVDAG